MERQAITTTTGEGTDRETARQVCEKPPRHQERKGHGEEIFLGALCVLGVLVVIGGVSFGT